jgi:glycosyltransferase involved in cell wall biosynthesis
MRGKLMQSVRAAFGALGPARADRIVEPRAIPDPASEPSNAADEIGFVLMGFPRLSETFITHEIHLLEELGFKLRLFAVKRGNEDTTHDVVGRIRAPLSYLPAVTSLSGTNLIAWLWRNGPQYSASHVRLLKKKPRAYLATLGLAVAMSWKYRRGRFAPPRKVFIKEFLQAGHIALQVIEAGTVRHLHGHFCHGATTIAWMASRMTGVPFSFTAHAKDIYQTDQNPGDLLRRKLKAARFAATCTGANADHLARRFPDCGRVHRVYHGLDTDYFAPAARERAGDSVPQILAVGRFVEKKGFRYLVEACALLKARGERFRCLMMGESGDQSASIRKKIGELGLDETVSMHGAVTHEALRRIYRASDIFALPCLVAADGDRDGIPNVLAEAMACGLAVVTTAVSGIPELVRDRIDGLIVPERDPQALADALRQLLQDRALRRRIGEGGRERVCRVFDSRKTTLQLKALFVDAMQSARGAT